MNHFAFVLVAYLLAHTTLLQAILYSLGLSAIGVAYTLSQSQGGLGLQLQINISGNSPPTWTAVGELITLARGDMREFDDATNMQSLAREALPTIMNPGKWSFVCNRVSNDAGQASMRNAFLTGNRMEYRIVFPVNRASGQTTTGDVVGFFAFLEKFTETIQIEKIIKLDGSFQVTNLPTYTQGS